MMFLVQTILTCGALAWLLHRVFQVLNKPLPELIGLLGLEVPQAPDLSLSGIQSDSVTLHWTKPSSRTGDVKYFVEVNGVKVGETSKLETVITVSGLRPSHFYNVRVVATNASNFHADSRAIQFKTQPWCGEPLAKAATVASGLAKPSVSSTDLRDDLPMHRGSTSSLDEPISSTLNARVMSRDDRGSMNDGKRPVNGHHASLRGGNDTSRAALTNGDAPDTEPESDPSILQLTKDLEALRREADDIQKLAGKELEEFDAARATLLQERDDLKHALKEKDDASADLKREVANLDRQNRSAQSRKATKEKALQQKLDERTRMQQDQATWLEEIAGMDHEIHQWGQQRKELSAEADQKTEEIRLETMGMQKSVKALEEEIRSRGAQVKELEEARKKLAGGDHDDGGGKENTAAEEMEEARREVKIRDLQSSYTKAMHGLQQAQENHRQAQERLGRWSALGVAHAADLSRLSAADLDLAGPSKKSKQRRGRQRKSRTNTVSSSNGLQVAEQRTSAPSDVSPGVVAAVPASPFFNMGHGMAVAQAAEPSSLPSHAMSQTEVEQLTGGAPMSPNADALLPSNLLGDEDGSEDRLGLSAGNMHIGPAFGGNALTSIGPPGFDPFPRELHSPASSGSRSASVFSSPRGSLNNLSTYPSAPESLIDSDRRSLHSLGAVGSPHDGGPSNSRRFANLFSLNLNRQRGKTLDDGPPMLGSLKAGQSSSFPVSLEPRCGEELDPIGTKRRRGIHSTSWVTPMTNFNFLNRNPTSAAEPSAGDHTSAPARSPVSRRRAFNMFSSKYDPLEPSKILGDTSSSRPTSISSFENALPRPSSDSQPFGWGPAMDGLVPHRSSPLSMADWSMRTNSGLGLGQPWSSQDPSRRNSIKHGSTSSLSLGPSTWDVPPPFADLEFHTSALTQHQVSPPLPIGARPASSSSSREPIPKLNPAAPTFKTIFSRSDAKKAEKAERAAEREKEKELEWLREDGSSPPPRLSKDGHSIDTASESVGEMSHESLDHSISGTPSESTTPSANGTKQSIFQKITRKSSSSKFNLPGWGKDKAGLFSSGKGKGAGGGGESPYAPAEIGEDEDEAAVATGKNADSITSSPNLGSGAPNGSLGRSSISWSTLMTRKQKRSVAGADKASSVSEASVSERASETGDDEDGGEDD